MSGPRVNYVCEVEVNKIGDLGKVNGRVGRPVINESLAPGVRTTGGQIVATTSIWKRGIVYKSSR